MDARAFELLVQRDRPALVRYARSFMRTTDAAEDVVQRALLDAWRRLELGHAVMYGRPWMFTIVRNTALNAIAAAQRRSSVELYEHHASHHDVAQEVEDRDELLRVMAAIGDLPPRQRDILVADIAGGLKGEVGATRQLLWRARDTIRRRFP